MVFERVVGPAVRRPSPKNTGDQANSSKASRKTRGNRRADEILVAAQQLFRDKGYAATSMEDIAQAVGILKGSLYYYMKSKDDLLYEILSRVSRITFDNLEEAQQADTSSLERVLLFVRSQVIYGITHPNEIAISHTEWFHLEGDRVDEIVAARRIQATAIIGLITDAKSSGEIPDHIDARLAGEAVSGIMVWPFIWYRHASFEPDVLAQFSVDFVRAGLSAF